MSTCVMGNLKGGVGKTTSAVNLSYCLSLLGKKVLVIDGDTQTNLTPFFTKANQNGRTIWDVIDDPRKVKSCIYRTRYKGIDIIKGDTALRETDVTDENWLVNVVEQLQDAYDICVIDTRPAFEAITVSALKAADMLLTPVCLDKFCRDNLALVDDFLSNMQGDRPKWNVFATKVDANRKAQRSIYEDLLTKHDYPFMETCISRSAVIDNALEHYKPVIRRRSNSQVAIDYMDLAKELLSLEG